MKLKLILALLITLNTTAQVTFVADSNRDSIGYKEKLKVTFSANNDMEDFNPPSFENFEIIGGPYQSVSNSWVDGKRIFNKTYAYFIQPISKGQLVIPSASMQFEGKIHKTLPLNIFVSPSSGEIEKTQNKGQKETNYFNVVANMALTEIGVYEVKNKIVESGKTQNPIEAEVSYQIRVKIVSKNNGNYLSDFIYSNFNSKSNDKYLSSAIDLKPYFTVKVELDRNGKFIKVLNSNEVNEYYKKLMSRTVIRIKENYSSDIQLVARSMVDLDIQKSYLDNKPLIKASITDISLILAFNSQSIPKVAENFKVSRRSPFGKDEIDLVIERGLKNNIINYSEKFDIRQLENSKRKNLTEQFTYLKDKPIGKFLNELYILSELDEDNWIESAKMIRHSKEGFGIENHQEIILNKLQNDKKGELEHSKKFYENGKIRETGIYKNGKRSGEWKNYHPNGQLRSVGSYVNGNENGEFKYYYKNGNLEQKGNFNFAKTSGEWRGYYDNGKLQFIKYFKDGMEIRDRRKYYKNDSKLSN